jgi:hypothetical protein
VLRNCDRIGAACFEKLVTMLKVRFEAPDEGRISREYGPFQSVHIVEDTLRVDGIGLAVTENEDWYPDTENPALAAEVMGKKPSPEQKRLPKVRYSEIYILPA